MTADSFSPSPMPEALQARLAAAGVTDEESLQAALAADPSLAADLQAYVASVEARPDADALFAAFAQVKDGDEMLDFWRSVPAGMEEPFIAAVEDLIARVDADGQADVAADLRARLDGFRQIHQQAQQAQMAQQLPPTQRAVMAFVFAPDDVAAETLFAEQKHLLQPYEAQELIDGLAAHDSADTPIEIQERLTYRAALLRRLRGHAPHPQSPVPSLQSPIPGDQSSVISDQLSVGGDLYQAGRDQYAFSAHAEGGGTATVVNNLFVQNLERCWHPPNLPARQQDIVPRTKKIGGTPQRIEPSRQRGRNRSDYPVARRTGHGRCGQDRTYTHVGPRGRRTLP